MRINQNIAAFNAYRNLSTTQGQLGKSLEKLSSGFRINRAADDAAGLVKSEGLRAEIRGTNQAVRNAQDGVSFVQTAEGALNEVHSILQRMRELAVSAANTATSDGTAENAEVEELVKELTAIGARTTFAGNQVLADYSGTGDALTFHVGAGSDVNANQLSIASNLRIDVSGGGGIFAGPGAAGTDVDSDLGAINLENGAQQAIATLDDAIAQVSTVRSELGATQNRLEHTISNLQVAAENLSASESRIRDTDMASEMVNFTRSQILQQAGTAMLAQANQVPQSVLSLLR
jgi:flagellin